MQRGYLGVGGGGGSRPGDLVCVVQGASIPMVLRPHADFHQGPRRKGKELGKKYAGAQFFSHTLGWGIFTALWMER